nr:hypothetical protein Q903MT_gene5203 [Picea sitchensis]
MSMGKFIRFFSHMSILRDGMDILRNRMDMVPPAPIRLWAPRISSARLLANQRMR